MKRDTQVLECMYELIGTHENVKAKHCVSLGEHNNRGVGGATSSQTFGLSANLQ